MDLSISPDWDAWKCYGLVLIIGLFVAIFRVRELFFKTTNVWFIPQTWFLLILYTLLPVALFWLLDRSGAINDTSVFAAILVGFAYQQIVTGKSDTIQAPSSFGAFWSPLLAWAEKIGANVRDRVLKNDQNFRDLLVRAASKTDGELAKYLSLAKGLTAALNTFKTNLSAIDAQAADLDTANLRVKRARLAVNEIALSPGYADAVIQAGLITNCKYFWTKFGFTGVRTAACLLLFAGLLLVLVCNLAGRPELGIQYSVWRLAKPNATKLDQFRSRERLAGFLDDEKLGPAAFEQIVLQLVQPNVPMDRINSYIQLLLQHRKSGNGSDKLPALLIAALRTESVDCRTRVHIGLVWLANDAVDPKSLPDELEKWTPTDGDSIEQLEDRVKQWRSHFGL